ncbi:MAG TPA: HD domain-containing protein [Planctomycetota bacterium]|nr:HD domain-containing protein [Planctomycetota bacterium]
MTTNQPPSTLPRAADYAARQHRAQHRKSGDDPHINHPLSVARRRAEQGGVDDPVTLAAALLHDTIEDTGATAAELTAAFGAQIAAVVAEVTDDKSLDNTEPLPMTTKWTTCSRRIWINHLHRLVILVVVILLPACSSSGGTPNWPQAAASLPEAGPAGPGQANLHRIVLYDDSGRPRMVLDANTGIHLYGANGKPAITLTEAPDRVVISCGQGTLMDGPDGPVWDPSEQVILGVAQRVGFVKVSGDNAYSMLIPGKGVQAEFVRDK